MNKMMFMGMLCFMPFCHLCAASTDDAQLEQLEEEEREMQSRARFAEDEADRLEFQDWIGYREHIEEYERYKNEAQVLQDKIDQMKHKKN